jgi:hypothetical protein
MMPQGFPASKKNFQFFRKFYFFVSGQIFKDISFVLTNFKTSSVAIQLALKMAALNFRFFEKQKATVVPAFGDVFQIVRQIFFQSTFEKKNNCQLCRGSVCAGGFGSAKSGRR